MVNIHTVGVFDDKYTLKLGEPIEQPHCITRKMPV